MTVCFHDSGENCRDRLILKMPSSTGAIITEQLFIIKLGMSSSPTEVVVFRRLMI